MSGFIQKLTKDSDEKSVLKRATVWNLIASLTNASMTAIIIFVLSWSNMKEEVGIFSIATAIAYQAQAVGFFGVRNLHIADVKHEYTFSDYVWANLMSSVVMFIVMVFMIVPKGYAFDKMLAIVFYTLYRAVDIYEAWFHDEYQRQGRVDIGLILLTVRYIVTLIVLGVVLILTKSLVLAFAAPLVVSVIMIWLQNKPFAKQFSIKVEKLNKERVWEILKISFPVCVATYVSMYLVNAGKYSIDNTLTDSFQAVFAVLIVPIFTINLLSTVIYKPYISVIAEHWAQEDYQQFAKKTMSMCLVILALTLGITLFGYVIGLWLLGVLYGTDLMQYRTAFVILLLGGGLNTYAQFFAQILVIIREQNKSLPLYIFAAAATFLIGDWMVGSYKIDGAAWLYAFSAVILFVGSVWIIVSKYRRITRAKTAAKQKQEECYGK